MNRFTKPAILLLISMAMFVRGYVADRNHWILHDKMSRSSTGHQTMMLWGAWAAVSVLWMGWLAMRDSKPE